MSDHLTYILWQQREQRMPHELEQQRVIEERLREQEQSSHEAEVPEHHDTDSTTDGEPRIAEFDDASAELNDSEAQLVYR